jgi:DNA repair exonuclease SbcCD ATPase subunit
MVENILGFDHKTFCQLFYQSSTTSLEFLTATDTNRKKFLVEFLDLTKYTRVFEAINANVKVEQQNITKLESKVETIVAWLNKNASNVDLVKKDLLEVPEVDNSARRSEAARIREDIVRIVETNKTITANNKYKALLDSIDLGSMVTTLPYVDPTPLSIERAGYEKDFKDAEASIKYIKSLKSVCPTCSHPIDNSKHLELLGDKEAALIKAKDAANAVAEKLLKVSANNKIIAENENKKSQWEQYHALYDGSIKSEILDKNDLEATLLSVENEIKKAEKLIADITKTNNHISAHNSKVDLLTTQIRNSKEELEEAKGYLSKCVANLSKLQILAKSFSTNGLIAFKIESMIKDLEIEVNSYLAELSYGRFQISFVISGEKLDVVISDNGTDVTMAALSSGEKARINTATLLAIRKVMQSISKVKVNLLVLDETIDNLDPEGKEKLVEILLNEEYLNTFVVSHGYSHPLLEKITVIKENNISRLE